MNLYVRMWLAQRSVSRDPEWPCWTMLTGLFDREWMGFEIELGYSDAVGQAKMKGYVNMSQIQVVDHDLGSCCYENVMLNYDYSGM